MCSPYLALEYLKGDSAKAAKTKFPEDTLLADAALLNLNPFER